ncbi:hypothetical protein EKD04_013895 [Chloroflexales bacterium ZM16-3]|nr:hypothetical protein [Chloroflexales bacterium ZM16-3]
MTTNLNTIRAYLAFPVRMFARSSQRRYIVRWLASLWPGATLRRPQPWLVFAAIDYLNTIDMRSWQIFEYGSGSSTLYWLRRAAHVTSIEHDAPWYERVRALLPPGAKLDYALVSPEPCLRPELDLDPADPHAYISANYPGEGLTYKRYVSQIDAFADGSLDLVLIDGRARASCLARAAPKVRPGGMLILDNSERAYYTQRNAAALSSYQPLVFAGAVPLVPVFSQTTIYRRRP